MIRGTHLFAPTPLSSPNKVGKLWKHTLCHRSAGHSSADLGLWSCRHHSVDRPRSTRFHLPELQQKLGLCQKYAEHSSGGLGHWNYLGRWICRAPHVTTVPSAKIAGRAPNVRQTCWTFRNWSWTLELSPPYSGSPHVTSLFPPTHQKAVTTTVWIAPCDNSVTSETPQRKRKSCSYLWPLRCATAVRLSPFNS